MAPGFYFIIHANSNTRSFKYYRDNNIERQCRRWAWLVLGGNGIFVAEACVHVRFPRSTLLDRRQCLVHCPACLQTARISFMTYCLSFTEFSVILSFEGGGGLSGANLVYWTPPCFRGPRKGVCNKVAHCRLKHAALSVPWEDLTLVWEGRHMKKQKKIDKPTILAACVLLRASSIIWRNSFSLPTWQPR